MHRSEPASGGVKGLMVYKYGKLSQKYCYNKYSIQTLTVVEVGLVEPALPL